MTSREYQQELCKRIYARLSAQYLKGVKRNAAAIEMLCGACYALEITNDPDKQLQPLLILTTLACTRDAAKVVESVAQTGEIGWLAFQLCVRQWPQDVGRLSWVRDRSSPVPD